MDRSDSHPASTGVMVLNRGHFLETIGQTTQLCSQRGHEMHLANSNQRKEKNLLL